MQLTWLVLAVICAAAPVSVSAQSCSRLETLAANISSNFTQVWLCEGVSKLQLYPHVWMPLVLNVSCPTADYSIYVGANTDAALLDALQKHEVVLWCGLESLLTNPRTCSLSLTPYGKSYVGLRSSGRSKCRLTYQTEFSYLKLGLFLGGLVLFFNADVLSASAGFRVTAGGVLFTISAVLVVLFIASRALPNKRSIFALLTAAGSVGWGMFRWLYGFWLPSLYDTLHNKFVLGYLVLCSLIGMAVTYYFDDTSNRKLNNILRTALQLLGLAAIYHGTTSLEVSAAVVSLVVATQVVGPVFRFASGTVNSVQQVGDVAARMLTPITMLTPVFHREPCANPAEAVTPTMLFSERTPLHCRTPAPTPQQVQERLHAARSAIHMRVPPPTPDEVSRALAARNSGQAGLRPNHTQGSGTAQPSTSTAAAAAAEMAAAFGSPLVQQGRIRNPLTGRNIAMHGKVYEELVQQGYSADLMKGVMAPLPDEEEQGTSGRSRPARSSGRTSKKTQ